MSTFLRYVSFISLYFDNRQVICLCESLHIWILKSPKDQREMSGVAYASMDADKKIELLAKNRRRLWNKCQLLSSSSTSPTHVSASGKYPLQIASLILHCSLFVCRTITERAAGAM